MAFSFEPFLAISAGHFMAVSAGPEHLESPLFDSVYIDWRFITDSVYDKIDLESRLATLAWEKKYFSDKGINPNDDLLFYFPRDIDYEISTVQEKIANNDAAFYGMLSKVSKNFADFLESNAKAHYDSSHEEVTKQQLKMIQKVHEFYDR